MISKTVTVIEPRTGWVPIDFRELWSYRELAWTLAVREMLVRYKQSVLGVLWAILQPLVTMIVFTILFTILLGRDRLPSPAGIPYAVSTFCALLPWQLFSQSVMRASTSIVGSQGLITKVYFPRLIVPLAPVIAAMLDFCIAFVVLLALMLYHGIVPDSRILWLPALVLFAVTAAFAVSLWFSALNALHRDVQYVVPFLVQILMYVSPVLYSASSVMDGKPSWVQLLYGLNPIAGVVEGFRWALLGSAPPSVPLMVASVLAVLALLFGGLLYFKRTERVFADVV